MCSKVLASSEAAVRQEEWTGQPVAALVPGDQLRPGLLPTLTSRKRNAYIESGQFPYPVSCRQAARIPTRTKVSLVPREYCFKGVCKRSAARRSFSEQHVSATASLQLLPPRHPLHHQRGGEAGRGTAQFADTGYHSSLMCCQNLSLFALSDPQIEHFCGDSTLAG